MEENLLTAAPEFKLYKDRAIYVGTFFGGPLVAGYLAAENFKQLGQQDKVKAAWAVAIAATVIIFGFILLVPDTQRIPRPLVPLIYTAIAQFLVQKYQGAAIKEHIENGGQTYSAWRAVWIGLIGLVILMAIIAAVVLTMNIDAL